MYETAAANVLQPKPQSVPMIESATSDIAYVVNELSELMHRIRQFADDFVGSRPTPLPGAESSAKTDRPPRRGEQLENVVRNLKDVQRALADEVSRLSAI